MLRVSYTIRLTFRTATGYTTEDTVASACPTRVRLRSMAYDRGAVCVQVARGNGHFRRVPRY